MSTDLKPRKHRHKRHYTIMIVSGDSDGQNKRFHLGHIKTQLLAFGAFALLLAVICYIVYSSITISTLKTIEQSHLSQIEELSEANASLESSLSELEATSEQLKVALNQKVETEKTAAEEDEQLHLPTGFPLNGTASMKSAYDSADTTTVEEDLTNAESEDADTSGDPIVIFTASNGSNIVATANGTVTSIITDSKYGNCITIDHGNGYITIYRNSGDVLVSEGKEVTKGEVLIAVGESNTTLGYQIQLDGEYIDPETMIEISG
ncbi:MAG: M23 family metallopeptidase [Butyrivibrio sp.]|nr:M23 family metallopeptidase [Butyrivibrio sp.]